jgi:hypothetical protein
MWTLARSSDISKRRRRQSVVRCLFALLILLVSTWEFGCVVTDKIKFEDAVNHQISIERNDPPDSITTAIIDVPKAFSVIVQDEEVTDTTGGSIQGLLEFDSANWSVPRFSDRYCANPRPAKPVDTEGEETPTFIVECIIDDWVIISDVIAGDELTVKLVVSDLGFVRFQPRQGATTAEILWMMQVQQASK